jgi:hypothetical protein
MEYPFLDVMESKEESIYKVKLVIAIAKLVSLN